jgi:hypothetical protein
MHDVLRTRVLRKLESLPEEQVYQILDYIEFMESKYARNVSAETSGLQSLAEKLEDQLRRRAVSPSSLREAFQLISAADKVLSNISNVGKELLGELNGSHEGKESRSGSRPTHVSPEASAADGRTHDGPGRSPGGAAGTERDSSGRNRPFPGRRDEGEVRPSPGRPGDPSSGDGQPG